MPRTEWRDDPGGRTVVSYVRRSPRMNPSQRQAMERFSDRYVLDVARGRLSTSVAPEAHIDWAPDIVEIGSGTGDALVELAQARPQARLLAFEVYERAVASTVIKLAAAGVENVRVCLADGALGLRHLVADDSLQLLCTFFPDPWHKQRHQKRRLIQPQFAELVARKLAPGGRWLLATDWPDYAEHMRSVLDGHPGLVNEFADEPGGWAPRTPLRPITRFEQRGLSAGRPVRDLSYRRPA